jgi:DNA-binding NarL/FixJ family response regulator
MTVADRLWVHVNTTDATTRAGLLTKLRHAGVAVAPTPDSAPDTVVLAAARTVDEALNVCQRPAGRRVMVVAETFSAQGALRAVGEGVGALLQSAQATPARLVDTLRSLRDGDGRMPHELLVRILGSGVAPKPSCQPTLTERQVAVLRLMADGLGNASIARSLSCSEHTIKNVIYELMTRLDARNRAHAVAAAVRAGLI